MSFDMQDLTLRIIQMYGTRRAFCQQAGYSSESALSARLNGHVLLDAEEISLWAELLEIPDDQIRPYFFTPKVR